jgi:hypothetical protein
MPEPTDAKSTEDWYDRDLDDPYFIREGKPTFAEKIMFLLTPVLQSVIVGRSLFHYSMQFFGFPYRYWRKIGSCCLQQHGYPFGYLTHIWQFKMLKIFGFRPGSYNIRLIVLSVIPNHIIQLTQLAHHTISNLITQYGNQIDMDQPADDYVNRWLGLVVMIGAISFQLPRKYIDKTPYGVYCCSKIPNAIIGRNFYLVNLQIFFNYYISRTLSAYGMNQDFFGQVVIPLAVFAWKRCLYFLEISTQLHESPFKGHAYVFFIIEALASMNTTVAMQQISVDRWNGVITYVIIDWVIYGLRMVIVARAGMKQCPKLISYLVLKQIENLPAPLTQHVEAKGDKTAMRIDQAYVALMEGETMTMNYVLHFINFAIIWGIFRIDDCVAAVPLRSGFLLLFYFALDFIQDALADCIGGKFNHWSYVYKLGGWHSKRMLVFQLNLAASFGGMFQFPIVFKVQNNDHRSDRVMLNTDWFQSLGGIMHY